jgi:hypothetical protein
MYVPVVMLISSCPVTVNGDHHHQLREKNTSIAFRPCEYVIVRSSLLYIGGGVGMRTSEGEACGRLAASGRYHTKAS